MNIERIKEQVEKNLSEYDKGLKIEVSYMLYNPITQNMVCVVSTKDGEFIEVETQSNYAMDIEKNFNFDEYFFKRIGEYEIAFVSDNIHYEIWKVIDELYPKNIDNKMGVQQYLKYCIDNKITKEYIERKTKMIVPDIMEYCNI